MTGLSRAQRARLIGQYAETGHIAARRGACHTFPSRYTAADVALPARVDQAHERLSGPATHEVTQWEVVAATPFISERYLLPALEAMRNA